MKVPRGKRFLYTGLGGTSVAVEKKIHLLENFFSALPVAAASPRAPSPARSAIPVSSTSSRGRPPPPPSGVPPPPRRRPAK